VGVEQNKRLLGGLQRFEGVGDIRVLLFHCSREFFKWRVDDMFELGVDRPPSVVQRIGEC
jgi:hypothetical protein